MNLLHLPNIVLIQIFEHLPYEEVSKKRLVCTKIDRICQHILNGGFNKVVRQHGVIFKRIKALLPRRESERRNHCMARHADILTSIETRISMLSMTYTKYIDLDLCCFIPGRVLDEIQRILRLISNTVKPLRPHEVLQELRDISSMAIEHFDEKIANNLKRSYHMYSSSSSTSRLYSTSEASKSKTFFSDYLDNKRNVLLLKSSSSQGSADALPNPSVLNTEPMCERVGVFQNSMPITLPDITDSERGEKKLQRQPGTLINPSTFSYIKFSDIARNCRHIHLLKNDSSIKTEEQAQLALSDAVLECPDLNNSRAQYSHHCREAKTTMAYVKKLELEYKKGVVRMQRMQQIQTQQSRRLQQALSTVAELSVQVVELRKRLEDVDTKNREISANMKQINTGDNTAIAESVSSSPSGAKAMSTCVPVSSEEGPVAAPHSAVIVKRLENDSPHFSKRCHDDGIGGTTRSQNDLSTIDEVPPAAKKLKT